MNFRKKKSAQINRDDTIQTVFGLILLLVILAMIWKLGGYIIEEIKNRDYSKNLQETVFVQETETEIETVAEGTEDGFVPLAIDFEKLQQISKDAVAWIYEPEMKINYVIAQSDDNEYYLTRQLDGTESSSGTLFMDYRNHSDFSDWNTIIYGHNMKSGTMFGSLLDYRQPGYYEEHPVMYLCVPDGYFKLELIAGCTVSARDDIYQLQMSNKETILDRIYRISTFESGIKVEEGDRLVTLSTCTYNNEDTRYIVIGRLSL